MQRFSVLAAISLVAFATATIRPGDPSLDPTRVHAGTDTLAVASIRGEQVGIVGVMFLQTSRAANDAISRKERVVDANGLEMSADSFALDANTFAPIYRVLAGATRVDTSASFHPNSLDIVLAGLPLSDGFSAELALDTETTELPSTAQVRVLRAEDVKLVVGTSCPGWMVEMTIGSKKSLYWIGRDSGALLQFVSPTEGIFVTRTRGCPGS